jgi:hypothetical protein
MAGYPTPRASDWKGAGARTPEGSQKEFERNGACDLGVVAYLAGYPTPTARDHMPAHTEEYVAEKKSLGHGMSNLNDLAVNVAGWATPATRDHKDTGALDGSLVRQDGKTRNDTVARQAFGAATISFPVATENRGALNPALSRWLMGFRKEWCAAAIRAYRSLKKPKKTRMRAQSAVLSDSKATATPSTHTPPPSLSAPRKKPAANLPEIIDWE